MIRSALLTICAAAIVFAGVVEAQTADQPVDAVTRATEWNTHMGEFAWLSDGEVPTPTSTPEPFIWATKGILVFEWEGAVELDRVRLYVGAVGNNYQVRTYVGGRLDETGTLRDPEGERTALIEVNDRVTDQWIDVVLPVGTRADNMELWTLGPTEFHEVEILPRAQGTPVQHITWSTVKAGALTTQP